VAHELVYLDNYIPILHLFFAAHEMANSGNCIPQLQRRFSKSCGCNVMRTLIIVDVFDIRQNKLMENFKAHTLNTKSLSMDLLEQFAVSGASDGNIKVFFLLPVSSFSSVSTAFPLPFSFCVPFSPLFSFFFPSHFLAFSSVIICITLTWRN
jgi:hypothetical protein